MGDGNEPDADRIGSFLADNERLKVEQLIVDGEKQLEAIIETHRQKKLPLYARRLALNQIRQIDQQTLG